MAETSTAPTQDAPAGHGDAHEHHIVPFGTLLAVFLALCVLTVVTYAASTIDLGRSVNILVALAIATFKGSLVVLYFMHLKYDKPFNAIVFCLSLGFLALFLTMASLDTAQYRDTIIESYSDPKMEELRKQYDVHYHDDETAHGGETPGGQAPAGNKEAAKWAKSAATTFGALKPNGPKDSRKNPVTPEKIALGRMLWYEARLSKNHDVSCNSCHDLAAFGVDGKPTSPGHKGQLGRRNSPTVFNAAFQSSQFWDGRASNVEKQAGVQILDPKEMAMPSEAAVVTVLKSIPGYAEPFKKAFPDDADPITFKNVTHAIAAFERRLVTRGPFDEFVEGKLDALTPQQVQGLALFVDKGCTTCHTGPTVGGTIFQKWGLIVPVPGLKDMGRYEVTDNEADEFQFKVPQLRNITKTGPYLHDGSVATLEEVIGLMAKHQLKDVSFNAEETAALIAFMESLTGKVDEAFIAKPALPESGPSTPAADPF